MNAKKLVVAAIVLLAACQMKNIPIPDPIRPNPPRAKIEPASLKFRIAVFDFVDQTGMAGGVVQTGGLGRLVKAGPVIFNRDSLGMISGTAVSSQGAGGQGAGTTVAAPGREGMAQVVGQTGGGAVTSIPDALSTALFDSGRFDLHDVGQLHNRTLVDTDKAIVVLKQMYQAWKDRYRAAGARRTELERYTFPDAILTGAVTSIDSKELTVDVRLMNFASDDVMFATSATIRVTNAGSDMRLDRDDLRKLAMKLTAALPSPKEMKKGQIVSREGGVVTVNLGKEDRLIRGMNAFVVSYGDKVVDPSTGDTLGDETFLGEIFVFAVYPRTAKARIFNGAESVRVGDYVVFK